MSVPVAARDVAAAVGALLVLGAVASVVGTVIVPRKTDAVPALWSGPRRHPATPVPPLRPGPGVTF
jgi:hypothetical protein